MNQNSYIRAAVRKIECGYRKKQEIKQQLQSEVKEKMEQGNTIHEVIGCLGTPEEITEKWSKQLPEEEKRKYKKQRLQKRIGSIVGVFICLGLLYYFFMPKTYPIELHGVYTEEQVEKELRSTIDLLDAGDYEQLQKAATKDMQKVMNQKMLDAAKHEIGENWGKRKAIGKIYMAETKQKGNLYAVTQTTVEYENATVTYTISFDRNLKVAGLYMK
ncbi:MAG: DUF3887 domain-containing protein [Lachnospiraceae bacterium]|nr:DUF3887 domain-containing protein [Lachnospiraceae bacterium]